MSPVAPDGHPIDPGPPPQTPPAEAFGVHGFHVVCSAGGATLTWQATLLDGTAVTITVPGAWAPVIDPSPPPGLPSFAAPERRPG